MTGVIRLSSQQNGADHQRRAWSQGMTRQTRLIYVAVRNTNIDRSSREHTIALFHNTASRIRKTK
jgi:hypothetical protein